MNNSVESRVSITGRVISSPMGFAFSVVVGSYEGSLWLRAWVAVSGCSTGVEVDSREGFGRIPSQRIQWSNLGLGIGI